MIRGNIALEPKATLSKRDVVERITGLKLPRRRAQVWGLRRIICDLWNGECKCPKGEHDTLQWRPQHGVPSGLRYRVRLELCMQKGEFGPDVLWNGNYKQAPRICRGRRYYTALGEADTLRDAAEMALVFMDGAIENGWYCVRLDPPVDQVAAVFALDFNALRPIPMVGEPTRRFYP